MMDIVLLLAVIATVGFFLYMGINLWRAHRRMKELDAELEATMLTLQEQLSMYCDGLQDDIGRLIEEQAIHESKTEVKH